MNIMFAKRAPIAGLVQALVPALIRRIRPATSATFQCAERRRAHLDTCASQDPTEFAAAASSFGKRNSELKLVFWFLTASIINNPAAI